jgi:hypothetical protein
MTGSSSDDWILLAVQLEQLLITLIYSAFAIHTAHVKSHLSTQAISTSLHYNTFGLNKSSISHIKSSRADI